MNSTNQQLVRHGSRIMAISVLLIVVLSAYKHWMHLFSIALAVASSIFVNEANPTAELKVEKDKYAYPASVPFRKIEAPSHIDTFSINVPIANKIFNKLHGYFNQSKSKAKDIKTSYVRINNYAHRILLIGGVADTDRFVFNRGQGYLTSLYHTHITNSTVQEYYLMREINKLINLQKEIPFKMIVAPPLDYNGIPADNGEKERIYQPFFKKRFDLVQNILRTLPSSIGRVNLYSIMRKEAKSLNEFLLRTDHHWRPEAGFWAFTHIASYLREHYLIEFPDSLLNKNNYRFETYKNALKGSHGNPIEISRDEYDDFTLITPKFETDYQLDFPSSNHTIRGRFKDVFLAKNFLQLDEKHPTISYGVYMGGDYPFIKIKNYRAYSKKKALIVKDSFSCVTLPFLAALFSETYFYDRRFEQESLEEYIRRYRPDFVIFTLRFPPYMKFHDD